MRFHITHTTSYTYPTPVTESFMEARLTPVDNERQRLLARDLVLEPAAEPHRHTDWHGNTVENFSLIHPHQTLVLRNLCLVETLPWSPPAAALELSVSEARQIYRSTRLALFEFLMPSPAIALGAASYRLGNRFFPPGAPLGDSIHALNHWLHRRLRYRPGTTTVDTPVAEVLRHRAGVCQDFAQAMIAILRSAEIPARYVTGYIETERERRAAGSPAETALVGASESHAWVEVALPGGFWHGIDPTNNIPAGERHVKLAHGRDHHDTTPTRGVFKGATHHSLKAEVRMSRQGV